MILGNEQPNEESRNLVHSMRTDAGDLNNRDLPGKIVFKNSFTLDEQVLLLMALDMQMQDSDMEIVADPVIITGAAESTESHTWMHAGTMALHGFIQLIQSQLNRLTKRGANPVVMDQEKVLTPAFINGSKRCTPAGISLIIILTGSAISAPSMSP